MRSNESIFLALGALSLANLYMPWLLLRRADKLSKKQLIALYPELNWIELVYPLAHTICVLALIALSLGLILALDGMFAKVAWFGAWFLAGNAAFDAVFALLTGIRPIPVPESYLFTLDSRTQRVSLLQLALAIATALITVLGISR